MKEIIAMFSKFEYRQFEKQKPVNFTLTTDEQLLIQIVKPNIFFLKQLQ
jgi:hypothetical protein